MEEMDMSNIDFSESVLHEEQRKVRALSSAKCAVDARQSQRQLALSSSSGLSSIEKGGGGLGELGELGGGNRSTASQEDLDSIGLDLDGGSLGDIGALGSSLSNTSLPSYDIRNELFERDSFTPYPHSEKYQRVVITGDVEVDQDLSHACHTIQQSIALRRKYISQHPKPPQDTAKSIRASFTTELTKGLHPVPFRRRQDLEYNVFGRKLSPNYSKEYEISMEKGVMKIRSTKEDNTPLSSSSPSSSPTNSSSPSSFSVTSFEEFLTDYVKLRNHVFSGDVNSYSYRKLEILLAKFRIHNLLNGERETDAQKSVPHRDFYNVRKVDTHVHHSACMNQKHLLRFIKYKLKHHPNDEVIYRDGKLLTLGEVFKSLHLTAYDLSIDTLDMHAHTTFERFDRFNLKYNPAGQSRLREIFLKTDNYIEGKYLAEITKEVMSDLEISKYQLVEWRLSIYGRSSEEWKKLAKWFYRNRLAHPNVRWMIQVPRLYHIYRENGEIKSFQEMMNNIFAPLFEITLNAESNPELFYFLETVVGFDSVDDESRPSTNLMPFIFPPTNFHCYWSYFWSFKTLFAIETFPYSIFYLSLAIFFQTVNLIPWFNTGSIL